MTESSNLPSLGEVERLQRLSVLHETNQAIQELLRRKRRRRIDLFFPDEGEFRRDLYPKHLSFFEAVNPETNPDNNRERAILAANRVGKTIAGCFELTLHLTGDYPDWWHGRRFGGPINAWAAGDTGQTTRDILQAELFGPPGVSAEEGTGMIPGDAIADTVNRTGIPHAIERAQIRHVAGGVSTLGIKSYDQKRRSFQGTHKHVILLDEEPPWPVYEECLLRTTGPGLFDSGMILATFTPLLGMSTVVMHYLGLLQQEDNDNAVTR